MFVKRFVLVYDPPRNVIYPQVKWCCWCYECLSIVIAVLLNPRPRCAGGRQWLNSSSRFFCDLFDVQPVTFTTLLPSGCVCCICDTVVGERQREGHEPTRLYAVFCEFL